MNTLFRVVACSVLLMMLIKVLAQGPPPPPSNPNPNPTPTVPKTNSYTMVEFAIECSNTNCMKTNEYRISLEWVPQPIFELDVEMETSTDLIVWTKTNISHKLPANEEKRFYRIAK